jgi:Protein of unknown function (DUF2948)
MAAEPANLSLRLRAEDEQDLGVISACLQDSLVLVGDLAYLPEEESFMLVANRFLWERGKPRPETRHERTLAGVVFGKVKSVAYRGFRKNDRDRLLSLLAVRCESAAGKAAILLEFSAGAVVRLEVKRIECRIKDLREPWPTPWRPAHDIGEGM